MWIVFCFSYPTIAKQYAKALEPPPFPDSIFIRDGETRGSETIVYSRIYCSYTTIESLLQHFQSYSYEFTHSTSTLTDGRLFEKYEANRDSQGAGIEFMTDLATMQFVPGATVTVTVSPKFDECQNGMWVVISRNWSDF